MQHPEDDNAPWLDQVKNREGKPGNNSTAYVSVYGDEQFWIQLDAL
jgi:hypothetical protein